MSIHEVQYIHHLDIKCFNWYFVTVMVESTRKHISGADLASIAAPLSSSSLATLSLPCKAAR